MSNEIGNDSMGYPLISAIKQEMGLDFKNKFNSEKQFLITDNVTIKREPDSIENSNNLYNTKGAGAYPRQEVQTVFKKELNSEEAPFMPSDCFTIPPETIFNEKPQYIYGTACEKSDADISTVKQNVVIEDGRMQTLHRIVRGIEVSHKNVPPYSTTKDVNEHYSCDVKEILNLEQNIKIETEPDDGLNFTPIDPIVDKNLTKTEKDSKEDDVYQNDADTSSDFEVYKYNKLCGKKNKTNDQDYAKPYKHCTRCNRNIYSEKDYKVHMDKHEQQDELDAQPIDKKLTAKVYTCTSCSQNFTVIFYSNCITHRFVCDPCLNKLMQKQQKALPGVCRKVKPLSCHLCDRTFLLKSFLKRHILICGKDITEEAKTKKGRITQTSSENKSNTGL